MGDLIDLAKYRGSVEKFVVLALCLNCFKRWIGTIEVGTQVFKLECPECGEQNSFISFIDPDYLKEGEH